MNMMNKPETVTIPMRRCGVTYHADTPNGIHINRVSLPAAPWQVEPEQKPEHKRPQDEPEYKLAAPQPQVASYRPVRIDIFSAQDQDRLREAWMRGIPMELRKFEKAPPVYSLPNPKHDPSIKTRMRVLDHIKQGEDTIANTAATLKLSESTTKRTLAILRDMGLVSSRYADTPNPCKIYTYIGTDE